DPGGTVDGVEVRAQIAVRQRDAFRRGGRSGGELHERDVVQRWKRLGVERRRGRGAEAGARQDERHIRAAPAYSFEPGDEVRACDDSTGAGAVENICRELEIA